jgi:flagellar biosynthesis GTPase FlhF
MKVVSFIAEDTTAALAQIHEQLGPEAVVISVRPLPARGLARLWQRNRAVEIFASVAEEGDCSTPVFTNDKLGCALARGALSSSSVGALPPMFDGTSRPHVFIGAPGVGKTTLLCKWLAVSVLNANRSARVWRLDGVGPNTAELLSVYGELLGVPTERFWSPSAEPADLLAVDLPGVQPDDSPGMRALKDQLSVLPAPRVHLVLNAAYDTSILTEQFRAFAPFKPEDLSFCHIDEERRQGKLTDFLAGTNCCLRFLSAGQKIPGELFSAAATPAAGVPSRW